VIAAARALVRDEKPTPDEPLKHLGHQLDRNVVQRCYLAGARRPAIAAQRQMFHGNQRVISFFG